MALHVERTRDWAFMRSVIENPEVFRGVTDDVARGLPIESFLERMELVLMNPDTVCLQVSRGQEKLGFFAFFGGLEGLYEMHTLLLPSCRGADSFVAARRALTEIFKTGVRVESVTPNRRCLWWARHLGFRVIGLVGSWTVDGKSRAMEHVAITKEQFCQSLQ